MDYLPIFIRANQRPCLVVGGGSVAFRKVELLLKAGAAVTVVAPKCNLDLRYAVDSGRVLWLEREFRDEDVLGNDLVVSATELPTVNERVAAACAAAGVLVNVVDNPALCSFVFPSIVDRSPLVVAVSTGGASPVLARQIRTKLEALIPAQFGRLAKLAGELRSRVRAAIPDISSRRRFWEEQLEGPAAELVYAGRDSDAVAQFEAALNAYQQPVEARGAVYLVGAGPGDPELLTLRALRLMQQADVVVYDRLVSPPILDLIRRDAERIYAGKQRNRHSLPQEDINRLLARLARSGQRVVRLKGGDPFIFGRGGEEIETLMDEGIPFHVVPGITAASGCASYAGIPLTHRDYAQSVTFITGHAKEGEPPELDWKSLSAPRQTLVIYMGLQGLDLIFRQLIAHGAAPDLPAALVQQGTTPDHAVVAGTLTTLPGLVRDAEVRAPTLVIVGEVVRLHRKLAWFRGRQSRNLSTR